MIGIEACIDDRYAYSSDSGVICPRFGSMDLKHVPLLRQEECALRWEKTLARGRRRRIGGYISLSIIEAGYPLNHHVSFNFAVAASKPVRSRVGETSHHRHPNLTLQSEYRPAVRGHIGLEVVGNRIAIHEENVMFGLNGWRGRRFR